VWWVGGGKSTGEHSSRAHGDSKTGGGVLLLIPANSLLSRLRLGFFEKPKDPRLFSSCYLYCISTGLFVVLSLQEQ